FAGDLATAMLAGGVSRTEQAQLSSTLAQIMAGADLPRKELEKLIQDANGILAVSGATPKEIQAAADHLKSLSDEIWNPPPEKKAQIPKKKDSGPATPEKKKTGSGK